MRNCVKVLDLAWLALWITGVILRAWSMWTEEVGGFDGKGIRGAVPPPPGGPHFRGKQDPGKEVAR